MKRRRKETDGPKVVHVRATDVQAIGGDLCLFCGEVLRGAATEEHVIPQWLLRELGIENERIAPTHRSGVDLDEVISERRHTLGRLVEGRVCRGCNCGWMAQLESEARPLLVELIHGRRDVRTLRRSEGLLLSRWVLKTTAVLNSSSNYWKLVPRAHYRAIWRGDIPEGVAAYAQQVGEGDSPFYWLQGGPWLMQSKSVSPRKLRRIAARAYKVALRFGRLLVMAAYWPEAGWSQARWKGVHILLSAPSGFAYLRDSKDFPWEEPSKALGAFIGSLSVAEDGILEIGDERL